MGVIFFDYFIKVPKSNIVFLSIGIIDNDCQLSHFLTRTISFLTLYLKKIPTIIAWQITFAIFWEHEYSKWEPYFKSSGLLTQRFIQYFAPHHISFCLKPRLNICCYSLEKEFEYDNYQGQQTSVIITYFYKYIINFLSIHLTCLLNYGKYYPHDTLHCNIT